MIRLRRFALAVVAMLLVIIGVDACDPGPKCLDYETATAYHFDAKGRMSTSVMVYCAKYENTPSR
ncbi:hypothetical protein [Kitasatospora sp. GP82]|uniref:hypothetical protein n=1 Tax=Kitasatospora sp. GP82 TaxID=3035089 RepID=UPI0024751EB6|nr:hypothetical protein [Kitasatospora sp. GP82]MDH6123830.1 hypothetical protein [Kitasatospora sp. GP82]MDH6576071.1 hypothetical protein [Kitasatospora sp. MAP5-34]